MEISNSTGVVVTGGASGLGAAATKEMADAGAHVTIFDQNAEQGLSKSRELGVEFVSLDVSDPESVARALKAASSRSELRVMINCAGIAPAAKTVSRDAPHDAEIFAKTISVNLTGTFNCASQAAAIMSRSTPVTGDGERGVIINTASVAAYEGQVGQVAYAASKGGIVAMTLPMARDLAQHGIRVCAIAPGLFKTPLLEGLPEEVQEALGSQVPFPARLGDPAEFASLVRHIVENALLNGEVIRLDGAIRMAPR